MNVIVTIDKATRQRSREEIPKCYDFTARIRELGGELLYYAKNDLGGVSAIIEV